MMQVGLLLGGMLAAYFAAAVIMGGFRSYSVIGVGGEKVLEEMKLTLPLPPPEAAVDERNATLYYGRNVLVNRWTTQEGATRYDAFVCVDQTVYPACRLSVSNGSLECVFATTMDKIRPRIYFDFNSKGKFDDFYLENATPLSTPIGALERVDVLESGAPIKCYDAVDWREVDKRLFVGHYGRVLSLHEIRKTGLDMIKDALKYR